MAEEASEGAWVWQTTVGGDSDGAWEKVWGPGANPLSDAEVEVRRTRLLKILFDPRPDES
ncbi:hypothetical protein [Streptomyces sp. NPDC059994]|uniref:hypothetical protein n=1 Tax=Streptomyces sp. NPDC059994 TaxID=3347029 RepID=UPI00367AAFBE